jgi:hypothetical protein
MSRKCLQKDVEILVEATDKSGGFIGKVSRRALALARVQGY